ncbi:hypothetical protein R8Z50_08780 [Longispora sp. K20-0274]|uniref:hypothetical protein n=1 Tax=Longispora sp. K20-0274 TaxID=3088255 RepID=UPI00399C0746
MRTDDIPYQQFWWLHDARWYQGVARRFGQRAANEINAEALRFVSRRVAAWCARRYGIALTDQSMERFLEEFARIPQTMWADGAITVEEIPRGENAWESVLTNSFVLKMLRAAKSLDGYECPCLQMRAGWWEGLGLTVRDTVVDCARTGGDACRFRAEVDRPCAPAARPGAGGDPSAAPSVDPGRDAARTVGASVAAGAAGRG